MDWNQIPYFDRPEFDDPLYLESGDNIDRNVVLILSETRRIIRVPIIIHGGVGGAVDMYGDHGHSDNSYHLDKNGCMAVDFHFKCDLPPREQIYWVLNSGFTGIGIYYGWEYNGLPLPVGFHGDVRPRHMAQVWRDIEGEKVYLLK